MIKRGCGDSLPISEANYRFVCELAMADAAIVLGEGKEYLVESRLGAVARRHHCASINALVDHLRVTGTCSQARRDVIDALTTNETFFFRDHHPFETLRDLVIPSLVVSGGQRRITVWSAACSTGQEPYSFAMLLREHFPHAAGRFDLLASDFSQQALRRAREGRYQQIEVNRGLPASYLVKYFLQDGDQWRLGESVRRMVSFFEINLARSWPSLPPCDLVLIRNVMIYFDVPTRQRILRQLRNVLSPGGLLLLGGAETTLMVDDGFEPVVIGKSTFYRRIKNA